MRGEGGLLPTLRVNRRSRDVILDWVNDGLRGADRRRRRPGRCSRPTCRSRPPGRSTCAGPGVAWMGEADAADRDGLGHAPGRGPRRGRHLPRRGGRGLGDAGARRRRAPRAPAATSRCSSRPAPASARSRRRCATPASPYRVEGGSLVYRTQELRDLINWLTAIDDPERRGGRGRGAAQPGLRLLGPASWPPTARTACASTTSPRTSTAPGPVQEGLRRPARAPRRAPRPPAGVAWSSASWPTCGWWRWDWSTGARRDAYRRARFVVEQARAFEADRPQSMRAVRRVAGGAHRGPGARPRRLRPRRRRGRRARADRPRRQGAGVPGRDPRGHRHQPAVRRAAGGLRARRARLVAAVGTKKSGRASSSATSPAVERARDGAPRRRGRPAALRRRDPGPRPPDRVAAPPERSRPGSGACAADRRGRAGAWPARWEPPAGPAGAGGGPPGRARGGPARRRLPAAHAAARAALVRRRPARAVHQRHRHRRGDGADRGRAPRGGRRALEPRPRRHAGWAARSTRPSRACRSTPAPAEVAAVAAAQAVAEAVPERAEEVAALVTVGPRPRQAAGRARAAAGALREVPFALSASGAVVEGFIDLVVPTGRRPGDRRLEDRRRARRAGVAERLAGYRLQAGLYARGAHAGDRAGRWSGSPTSSCAPAWRSRRASPAALADRAMRSSPSPGRRRPLRSSHGERGLAPSHGATGRSRGRDDEADGGAAVGVERRGDGADRPRDGARAGCRSASWRAARARASRSTPSRPSGACARRGAPVGDGRPHRRPLPGAGGAPHHRHPLLPAGAHGRARARRLARRGG